MTLNYRDLDQKNLDYWQSDEYQNLVQTNLQEKVEKLLKAREAEAYKDALTSRKNTLASHSLQEAQLRKENPFSFDNSASVLAFEGKFNTEMGKLAKSMSPERAELFEVENLNIINELKLKAIALDEKQLAYKDTTAWEKDLQDFHEALESGDGDVVDGAFMSMVRKQEAGLMGGVIDERMYNKRMGTLQQQKDKFDQDLALFEVTKAEAEVGPQGALEAINETIASKEFEAMDMSAKSKIYKEKLRLQGKMTKDGGSLNKQAIAEQKQVHSQIEKDFFSGAPQTRIQDYVESSENLEEAYYSRSKNKSLKQEVRVKAFRDFRETKLKKEATLIALRDSKFLISEKWDSFGEAVLGKGKLYDDKGAMTLESQFVFKFYRDLRAKFNHFKGAKDQVNYIKWVQGVITQAPPGYQQGMDVGVGLTISSSAKKVKDFINSLPEKSRAGAGFAVSDGLEKILTEQHLRQTLFDTKNPSMTKEQQQEVFKAFDYFVRTKNLQGVEGLFEFLNSNLSSWEAVSSTDTEGFGLAPSQKIFYDSLKSVADISNSEVTGNVFVSLGMATGTNEEKEQFSQVFGVVSGLLGKWLTYKGEEFSGLADSSEALKNMLTHAITGYLLKTPGGLNLATQKGVKIGAILGFGNIEGMLEAMKDNVIEVGPHIIRKNTLETPPKPGETEADENTKKHLMLQTHLSNSLNLGRSKIGIALGSSVARKFGTDHPETNPELAKQFIATALYLAGEKIKSPEDLENFRLNGLKLQMKEGDTWVNVQHKGEDFEFNQRDFDNYAEQFGGDPQGYWEGVVSAFKEETSGGATFEELKNRFGPGLNLAPQALEIVVKAVLKGLSKKNKGQGEIVFDHRNIATLQKSGGNWALRGSFSDDEWLQIENMKDSEYVKEVFEARTVPTWLTRKKFDILKGASSEQAFTAFGHQRHVNELRSLVKKSPAGGFNINWSVDGDTFDVDFAHPHPKVGEGLRVRLVGVDAPEKKLQPAEARKAQIFVDETIKNAEDLRIVYRGVGFHGRVLADFMVDGVSLSKMMQAEGVGVKYEFDQKRR